jgi:DNA-binding response OmpR family regulator
MKGFPMPYRKRSARRVLIVEDRLAHGFVMRNLFERQGWAVSLARTLDEGMDSLERSPDWIVLNLGLANDGGERFLRRMRAEGTRTPVVALSPPEGLSDQGLVKLMRTGSVVAMPYPIDFRLLYSMCTGEYQTEAGVA